MCICARMRVFLVAFSARQIAKKNRTKLLCKITPWECARNETKSNSKRNERMVENERERTKKKMRSCPHSLCVILVCLYRCVVHKRKYTLKHMCLKTREKLTNIYILVCVCVCAIYDRCSLKKHAHNATYKHT